MSKPVATKSIVFVHGHHFKPAQDEFAAIGYDALRWGIARDFPEKAAVFDAIKKEFAYFGDLSNHFLIDRNIAYDERLDIADRKNAVVLLKEITKRKRFRRYEYQHLPGKTAVKEILADVGSPLLGKLGLEQPAIGKLAPEVSEYWRPDSEYGQLVRDRVRVALTHAITHSDKVMVVAHCMGSIAVYDVLWELSQSSNEHKVDLLLTLGCPLGNRTVQKNLAGHGHPGAEKYPANILAWDNISAEDDYVCHDKTVADDFRQMLKLHLISSINDYRIYNMAVRYGKSNPHSSVGYLIHPRTAKLIADWL